MQEQTNGAATPKILPGLVYKPTATRWVAKRGGRYMVRWTEEGQRRRRTFGSYEAACAFVRDYVQPYKAREGALPPSAIAPAKGSGWVYVFRSSGLGEPVKIGWSTDPARRLRDLSTGHPYKIDLVALLPGTRGVEKALHARLADFRLEGEWFSREAESAFARLITDVLTGDDGLIALPADDPCNSESSDLQEEREQDFA